MANESKMGLNEGLTKIVKMYMDEYQHNVERIPYKETSLEDFRRRVESQKRPVIITDTVADFQDQFHFSFKVEAESNGRVCTRSSATSA